MREIHAAIERFDLALARLEAAVERRVSDRPVKEPSEQDDAAGLIARLRRENEALRAARAEEAELRGAALRRVDVAIAALEAAVSSRATGEAAAGRSRAMFGDVEPESPRAEGTTRGDGPARQGRAAAS